MICPDCLEDYTFIRFDVDPETLEHRGEFSCACMNSIYFPESITREMIDDEDLQDQLRISRLHHLSCSLQGGGRPAPRRPGILAVGTRHLQRYLETVSEQTLRQLK